MGASGERPAAPGRKKLRDARGPVAGWRKKNRVNGWTRWHPCHSPHFGDAPALRLVITKSFHFGDAAAFERNGRFNRMREILPAIPIGIWRFEIRMDGVSPSPISDLRFEIGKPFVMRGFQSPISDLKSGIGKPFVTKSFQSPISDLKSEIGDWETVPDGGLSISKDLGNDKPCAGEVHVCCYTTGRSNQRETPRGKRGHLGKHVGNDKDGVLSHDRWRG
jgi:hypothetical protein